MGKVLSLKEASFQRSEKSPHALTVYINNIDNPEIKEEAKKPLPKAFEGLSLKELIPFGTPIPREYTLAGAMEKLAPTKGNKK